jgi:DNA-binding GntR family transcriptional regulator
VRPEEIAAALRRALRERDIPPGQAMNQDELARQFGVSRIPLREALRTLAGEGLVTMKPGLGAVVTELRPTEVQELYGLRLQLEPPLAEDIVDHVRRRDVDDLAAFVDRMGTLGEQDADEWSSARYRFNRRLYEISDRRHAVRLVVQVLNLVEPYARVDAHVLGARARTQAGLEAMVRALREGDATRLAELVREDITTEQAELLESFVDQVDPVE